MASSDRTATLMNEVAYIYDDADTSVIASLNVPVALLPNDLGALYSDTLSGATKYFKNSESSQEFLRLPTTRVPGPAPLFLLTFGLAGLGGIARRYRKG